MPLRSRMRSLWRNVIRRRDVECELEEELQAARELLVEEKLDAGLSPEAARRTADLELGGMEQVKERVREARVGAALETAWRDLCYAMRALVRAPAFSVPTVVTLALGVGANVAVLAVTYGILVRPLPYREPSRLVIMSQLGPDGTEFGISPSNIGQWLERLRAVERAAGYSTKELTVMGGSEPRVVRTALVTEEFFEVLGVPALIGQPNGPLGAGEAVLGDELARQLAKGSLDDSIARNVKIGTRSLTVARVMPVSFAFPSDDVRAWVPAPPPELPSASEGRSNRIVARLKPEVTLQQALGDATRVFYEVNGREHSGSVYVAPLEDMVTREIRPVLHVFLVGGLLVLIIACANVTTLFIGHLVRRSRDSSVRAALGAGPLRLGRAVLAEVSLMAVAGSMLGVALAVVVLHVFLPAADGLLPRVREIGIDLPIVACVIGLTVGVTFLCGAIPVWWLVRADRRQFVRTMALTTPSAWRVRWGLVASQIALCAVLLTGAGLLMRTLDSLLGSDPGFKPAQALEAKLVLSDVTLSSDAQRHVFVQALVDRVRALPGVQYAGLGSNLPPLKPLITIGMQMIDANRREFRMIKIGSGTPGYLKALGVRWVGGRDFEEADGSASEGTAVLSESAARFIFPGQDAIGRQLPSLPPIVGGRGRLRVVGVVSDVRDRGLDAPAGITIYLPWERRPVGTAYLVIRTLDDPAQLVATVRRIIADLDRSVPVPEVQSLEDALAGTIANRQLRVVPAAGFAALSLAVALVGLLGTLTSAVAERRQELAIRSAVGASPGQLTSAILRTGTGMTAVGLAAGMVAAAVFARGLAGLLYGVRPYDPTTFGTVGVLVTVCSLAVTWLSARRAGFADPAVTLRYE